MYSDLKNNKKVNQIDWNNLFTKNAASLKGLCRRYVGDEAIAEDIVQETFITGIEKINTFSGKGSIEGWIRKIAINKALLYIKEKHHKNLPLNESINPTEQEKEMEFSNSNTRLVIENASFSTDELMSVIDSLPDHHKSVFNMYVIDGFSHQQISEMMNISTNTSKSHLLRARKKAQELLFSKASPNQNQNKKLHSLWVLLLFRPNYIDTIFRKGFKNFELPIQAPAQLFPTSTVQALKWKSTLMGKTVSYGIITTSATVAVIVGTILWNQGDTNSIENKCNKKEINTLPDTIQSQPLSEKTVSNDTIDFVVQDTITPTNKNTLIPSSKTNTKPKEVKKTPVIIKKTIIIHDTLHLEKTTTN